MAKKQSASSRRAKRVPAKEIFTIPLSKRERTELSKLGRMPESKIDYSDVPELKNPSKILVGRFYRPVKQLISLRVDADVLAWFRSQGSKYQTYMNEVLRREMQRPRRAS